MKKYFCLASLMALACFGIDASAQEVAPLTSKFTELGPKPSFTIQYSKAVEAADGTTLTKEYIRQNVTFVKATDQNTNIDLVVAGFDDDDAITEITFIVADYVYLTSYSKYYLTMPALRYVDDSSSAQSSGDLITLYTDTYTVIDRTTSYTAPTTSSYATNVVIASGTTYTADPSFSCKQLVIEPGAALFIPGSRAVVVMDSLYLMAEVENINDLNNAYLINEGTLEVKGKTIVTKDVSLNYGASFYNTYFSSPIYDITFNSMTLQDPDPSDWNVCFHPATSTSPIVKAATDKTTTYTTDNFYNYLFCRNYYYSPAALRFKGDLSFDAVDYGTLTRTGEVGEAGDNYRPIPNPYPAPLNLRGLVTDGKLTGVHNLYVYRPLNRNASVCYNVFSGLTTYDEVDNMQKGYLLPSTGIAVDYFGGEATYAPTADYTAFADTMASQYSTPSPFPYVRFAIDYADESAQHGTGKRDVAVLYFVTDPTVTEDMIIADSTTYNTMDYYMTSGYSHFPAICTWQTSDRSGTTAVKIAAMPMMAVATYDEDGYPESDAEEGTHSLQFMNTDNTSTLTIKVLDSNLGDYNIGMYITNVTGEDVDKYDLLTNKSYSSISTYADSLTTNYGVECYWGYIELLFKYTDDGALAATQTVEIGDDPTSFTADDGLADLGIEVPESTTTYTSEEISASGEDYTEEFVYNGGDPDYVEPSTAVRTVEATGAAYRVGTTAQSIIIMPDDADTPYRYTISDLGGRTATTGQATGNTTVSIGRSGIYFVTIDGATTKVVLR